MNGFRLTVASPNGNIFDEEVVMLSVRGTEGELAIMAGHVPFVTSVKSAPCKIWIDDDTAKEASLDGGLLTVDKSGATLIAGSFKFKD